MTLRPRGRSERVRPPTDGKHQLTEAVNLVEALRDDLQGVLDGWGDSFAGSERYTRFEAAVGELEGVAEALESVDVSWG